MVAASNIFFLQKKTGFSEILLSDIDLVDDREREREREREDQEEQNKRVDNKFDRKKYHTERGAYRMDESYARLLASISRNYIR